MKLITAKAEETQGAKVEYCMQNIRTEIKLSKFNKDDFILFCLRRSKMCNTSCILQFRWSVILQGSFNETHFLGFLEWFFQIEFLLAA